jgi:fatty-acyl-CoA synthase
VPKYVTSTIVDAVRALAHDTARGFVFVRPDGSERLVTFHDIHDEAHRRGAHLAARGLRKGDRLALVIPDGDEFVLSFLGALFAGVVPVPIYPQLSFKNIESYHDSVAHLARASGASMLLTTTATRPYVERLLDRGEPLDPRQARVQTLRSITTIDEIAGPAPRDLEVDVTPDDLAFLQFTSGSTSRPKGVMVTHNNLAENSEAFMIHGLAKDHTVDKGVSWLPLFHDMGLIGFVVGPLFTNIPCVFIPTASFVRSPRVWLEKIHQHRGTITYAPNFAYALVAKRLKDRDVAGLDLSCLRIAGCGAEPIQAKSLRDFAERLAPAGFDARAYLPSYGMAEATLAITFVPLRDGLRTDAIDPRALENGSAAAKSDGQEPSAAKPPEQEIVDCGRTFPEHEIAVVDDQGRRLGERQVGEIVARGPSITKGYYQEPELTAAAFKPLASDPAGPTWLHTGDLGYIADGHLYVCGRLKDMIIIRGRNYYPTDIEWAVGELPGVRRGNVVAFGKQVDGEEQLVVCAEGMQSEAAALRDAIAACVSERFGLTAQEIEIVPQGTLPRTSSGKAQRRKTKQLYLEGTLARARVVQGTEGASGAGGAQGAEETSA